MFPKPGDSSSSKKPVRKCVPIRCPTHIKSMQIPEIFPLSKEKRGLGGLFDKVSPPSIRINQSLSAAANMFTAGAACDVMLHLRRVLGSTTTRKKRRILGWIRIFQSVRFITQRAWAHTHDRCWSHNGQWSEVNSAHPSPGGRFRKMILNQVESSLAVWETTRELSDGTCVVHSVWLGVVRWLMKFLVPNLYRKI